MPGGGADSAGTLVPPARKAFPAPGSQDAGFESFVFQDVANSTAIKGRLDVAAPRRQRSGVERTMTRLFMFVLFIGVLAVAFYAGRKYKGSTPYLDQGDPSIAEPSRELAGAPAAGDDPLLKFERGRREVDNDPNAWLTSQLKNELSRQGIQNALESTDAEFLYLYGRASLLVGDN